MRRLIAPSYILLALTLAATPALAGPWTVFDPPRTPPDPAVSANCLLGTVDPPEASAPTNPEPYELCRLIRPEEQCPECPIGHDFTTLRAVFDVRNPPGQACELRLVAQVKAADMTDPDCPRPGLTECRAGGVRLFFVSPGLNEIVVPFNCPCASKEFPYFVSIGFVSTNCDEILRTSTVAPPAPSCTSYIQDSDAIIDEASLGIPGVIALSANSSCCDPIIPLGSGTWGSLKGRFDE